VARQESRQSRGKCLGCQPELKQGRRRKRKCSGEAGREIKAWILAEFRKAFEIREDRSPPVRIEGEKKKKGKMSSGNGSGDDPFCLPGCSEKGRPLGRTTKGGGKRLKTQAMVHLRKVNTRR